MILVFDSEWYCKNTHKANVFHKKSKNVYWLCLVLCFEGCVHFTFQPQNPLEPKIWNHIAEKSRESYLSVYVLKLTRLGSCLANQGHEGTDSLFFHWRHLPRWRRGSRLDCGSGDLGSIPSIPSACVDPLMARRLKTSSDVRVDSAR